MLSDPLINLPGYALRRISAAFMGRFAARLAGLDLRPTEASVLLVIAANSGATQSEIGRLLGIASANLAPLAARLVKRDLIIRQAVDGRSQGLTLSVAGRRIAQKVRKVIDELEADLLARVPEADRIAFLRVLGVLTRCTDG